MKVAWTVDREAANICWKGIADAALINIPVSDGDRVLDVGGGNGNFSSHLFKSGKRLRIVSVDVDREPLSRAVEGIEPVQGNILQMPFRDGAFDAATGMAIYHHLPDMIGEALQETRRVLKPGGFLLIQEPCSRNLPANMARLLFSTEIHELGEKPVDPVQFEQQVRALFQVEKVGHHFFTSYLMPHIVARAPARLKNLLRKLTALLSKFDRRVPTILPGIVQRCGYISIVARRSGPDHPLKN